jgi:hypothetical protein
MWGLVLNRMRDICRLVRGRAWGEKRAARTGCRCSLLAHRLSLTAARQLRCRHCLATMTPVLSLPPQGLSWISDEQRELRAMLCR